MSRYMINKLLWEAERTEESLNAFVSDSVGFIRAWERTVPLPPHPSGGTLTPEERTAFELWDYPSLYRMGAHPFLLWQFARSVWVAAGMDPGEFAAAYRAGVGEYGHPDFTT